MKQYLANKMRRWADRLDHAGAPKATHLFFTYEKYKGIVFNDEQRGCRLWYLNDAEYEKAHAESLTLTSEDAFAQIIRKHAQGLADIVDLPRTLFESGPTSGEALRFRVGKSHAHIDGVCQNGECIQ